MEIWDGIGWVLSGVQGVSEESVVEIARDEGLKTVHGGKGLGEAGYERIPPVTTNESQRDQAVVDVALRSKPTSGPLRFISPQADSLFSQL